MWRYSANPIIERFATKHSNSIFNSAVVPYGDFSYKLIYLLLRSVHHVLPSRVHQFFLDLRYGLSNETIRGSLNMISINTKYPEKCLQFLDLVNINVEDIVHAVVLDINRIIIFVSFQSLESL